MSAHYVCDRCGEEVLKPDNLQWLFWRLNVLKWQLTYHLCDDCLDLLRARLTRFLKGR